MRKQGTEAIPSYSWVFPILSSIKKPYKRLALCMANLYNIYKRGLMEQLLQIVKAG